MRFGATHFLDFKTDNVSSFSLYAVVTLESSLSLSQVTAEVHRLTNNLGANAVICTAGSLWAYKQATECVRNAGTIVCVGINPSDLPISPFELVRRGKKHSCYWERFCVTLFGGRSPVDWKLRGVPGADAGFIQVGCGRKRLSPGGGDLF